MLRRHLLPGVLLAVTAGALGQSLTHTLSGHATGLNAVAFSPDGRRVVTCGAEEPVRVWDAATGTLQQTLNERASAAAYYPNGQRIVLGSRAGNTALVKILNASTFTVEVQMPGHPSAVQAVAVSPDGQLVASGSERTVKVWDARSGELRATLDAPRLRGTRIVFAPDNQTLATNARDGLRLFDVQDGTVKRELEHEEVNSLAISPDGKWLASGSGSVFQGILQGEVRVWEVATGELKRTHKNLTTAVAFTPDSKFLATGGSGDTLGDIRLLGSGLRQSAQHPVRPRKLGGRTRLQRRWQATRQRQPRQGRKAVGCERTEVSSK